MAHAVIGVDPRIRARRVAVRRAEGRRRLRFVLGGVGFVVLVAGLWGISRTPLFDLDHVRVDGIVAGSVEEVDLAAGASLGSPLLDVDLEAMSDRVEALPWVEKAEARRDWPGTVRIEVVERVPVARMPAGDGSAAIVDAHGVVTSVVAVDRFTELPLVAVDLAVEPGVVQEAVRPGLAVVIELSDDLVPWIDRILVGHPDEDRVALELGGGAVALLGDTTLLADKLTALRAVLAGADLACIATIDVSVADLTTVTRDPVCDGRVTPSDG